MFKKVLIVFSILGFVSQLKAGPQQTIGKLWPNAQRVSMDRINHQPWDQLLKKYVDDRGNVDYTRWKSSEVDRQLLTAYLNHLSQTDRSLKATQPARLAFWINAYNAVTIDGILRLYPTTSIRNHTAKIYGYNIWHDHLLQVGDQAYSLDQIEHKILRTMKEPRIHFAIVCASHSCPPLRNEAYVADRLDQQLAENSRAFFANPENMKIDAQGRVISLNSILDWFAEDFGSSSKEQLKTIAVYLPTDKARQLANQGALQIKYLDYNWALNDFKTKGKR